MAYQALGTTTDPESWFVQSNYVERIMDNAAFTAAHPNNTLVLAGPARFDTTLAEPDKKLLPIGMLQTMSVAQQRPLQPMQALGSGRSFFVAGKGQVSFNIARLLVNGRNLMRVLYTNAVQAGIQLSKFDEPPVSTDDKETFLVNLDSELFYVPFGLAVLFRSPGHDKIGAFYLELCMLNAYQVAFSAGQAMIMENVSGLADRMRPIYPNAFEPGNESHPKSSTLSEKLGLGAFPAGTPDTTPNMVGR